LAFRVLYELPGPRKVGIWRILKKEKKEAGTAAVAAY
jgi:hypothetical protein